VSLSRIAADLALSMPAKSRLGRLKIAFSASFGVVRRAPLIHKAAIRCTLFRGVRMHCLCRAVHQRATPYVCHMTTKAKAEIQNGKGRVIGMRQKTGFVYRKIVGPALLRKLYRTRLFGFVKTKLV